MKRSVGSIIILQIVSQWSLQTVSEKFCNFLKTINPTATLCNDCNNAPGAFFPDLLTKKKKINEYINE